MNSRFSAVIGGVLLIIPLSAKGQVALTHHDVRWVDVKTPQPVATTMSPDGGLIIADGATRTITRLGVDGVVKWRVGGEGSDLGQFRFPSRLSQVSDSLFALYDIGTKMVVYVTTNGVAVRRWAPGMAFRTVDALALLDGGDVAIAGFAESRARHAVHIFSSEGIYKRSVAEVPLVREQWVLNYWGVGPIVFDSKAQSLRFVRKLPYEIYSIADGEAKLIARHPSKDLGVPDDAYVRTVQGDSFRLGHTNAPVAKPAKAYPTASGKLIVARLMSSTLVYDVFSDALGFECTVTLARPSSYIVGINENGSGTWIQTGAGDAIRFGHTSIDWRNVCVPS